MICVSISVAPFTLIHATLLLLTALSSWTGLTATPKDSYIWRIPEKSKLFFAEAVGQKGPVPNAIHKAGHLLSVRRILLPSIPPGARDGTGHDRISNEDTFSIAFPTREESATGVEHIRSRSSAALSQVAALDGLDTSEEEPGGMPKDGTAAGEHSGVFLREGETGEEEGRAEVTPAAHGGREAGGSSEANVLAERVPSGARVSAEKEDGERSAATESTANPGEPVLDGSDISEEESGGRPREDAAAEEHTGGLLREGEAGEEQGRAELNRATHGDHEAEGSSEANIPAERVPSSVRVSEEKDDGERTAATEGTANPGETAASVVPVDLQEGGDEEEQAGIDFQLYLPQQLRKVIPGTNVDYYDYVILEERRARGETDAPPDVRGGLLPDGPEKETPQVTLKNGVFAYCYTVETDDILSRCVDAAKLGEGVYIPMVNMSDFGRHDDHQRGNPSLQEVHLSPPHYTEAVSHFPASWLDAVGQLKKRTRLAVGGLWFGPPDFKEMDAVLRDHPNIFDGILVDWDSGEGACMNQLRTPPPFNVRGPRTV